MKRKMYQKPQMRYIKTDLADVLTASVDTEPFMQDVWWEGLDQA